MYACVRSCISIDSCGSECICFNTDSEQRAADTFPQLQIQLKILILQEIHVWVQLKREVEGYMCMLLEMQLWIDKDIARETDRCRWR